MRRAEPLTPDDLLAAAEIIDPGNAGYQDVVLGDTNWQHEAWNFYHNLGEFSNAVRWRASAISRMRLVAAEQDPDAPEPVPVTDGPAVELVRALAGGKTRQPAMLRTMSTLLDVPGEAYMTVEEDADGSWDACAHSTRELRPSQSKKKDPVTGKAPAWELMVGYNRWRPLAPQSLVGRVYDADEQFHYLAESPARAALPIMRELDLINRYIIATLLSRLAMNGIMLFPSEMNVVVPKSFGDAPDAFTKWLYDAASKAIKNPGTPSAAIPFVLKVPAQFVDMIKHISFATPFEKDVFEKRDLVIARLGTALNVAKERITGVGEVNHWGQWQIAEEEIKINLVPTMETICDGITEIYLQPLLGADGRSANGNRLVVWYDATELTARPDLSKNAIELRKLHVINDEATRRETGFDEDDAPTPDELKTQILTDLTAQPTLAEQALKELTGVELPAPPAPPTPPPGAPGDPNAPPTGDQPVQPGDTAPQPPPQASNGVQPVVVVRR